MFLKIMKLTSIPMVVLLFSITVNGQNTFKKSYSTNGNDPHSFIYCSDIIELPNGDFFFSGEEGYFDPPSIYSLRINNNGDVVDGMRITVDSLSAVSFAPGDHVYVEEDSSVITYWHNRALSYFGSGNFFPGFHEHYLYRWKIFPTIDSLIVKKINLSYLNNPNFPYFYDYWGQENIRLSNGDFLMVGNIHDSTFGYYRSYVPHLHKYDSNLNTIWETIIPPTTGFIRKANYIKEAPDGSYLVSGFIIQGDFQTKAWIAKLDTNGSIEWENILPTLYNDTTIRDGEAAIAFDKNGNIALAYTQTSTQPQSLSGTQLGRIRFLKLDLQGNILMDNLIGPENTFWVPGWGIPLYIHPTEPDGFIVSATMHYKQLRYRALVLKLSESGDSTWWHEPYFDIPYDTLSGGKDHYSPIAKPVSDGGYIVIGTFGNMLDFANPRRNFVLKLDSNGCFGPDSCHTRNIVSVAVHKGKPTSLNIFPNPASDKMEVIYTTHSIVQHEISLTDLSGKTLLRQPMQQAGEKHTATLNIQHLPAGMYMVELWQAGEVVQRKKVVKN
jgi:hypothetical protein